MKVKTLIRLEDGAVISWNQTLANKTNKFRESFVDSGTLTPEQQKIADLEAKLLKAEGMSEDQIRIRQLEAKLAQMETDKTEQVEPVGLPADDQTEDKPDVVEAAEPIKSDKPDKPAGTVGGKSYDEWTKPQLLQLALEKYNSDLPNNDLKSEIFMACQVLESAKKA